MHQGLRSLLVSSARAPEVHTASAHICWHRHIKTRAMHGPHVLESIRTGPQAHHPNQVVFPRQGRQLAGHPPCPHPPFA